MRHPARDVLRTLYDRLEESYGYQGWWPLGSRAGTKGHDAEGYRVSSEVRYRLDERERLEIAVGAILTQNTAWTNAREALAALRRRTSLLPEALEGLPVGELADTIRSSGYFNQKAQKIETLVRHLRNFAARGGKATVRRQGRAPARNDLLSLWGIGPETADSILLYAYGEPYFVIDAYARRILTRMGVVPATMHRYEEFQQLFHDSLPRNSEVYGEFHALFVRHGRSFCRKSPRCTDCPLRTMCGYSASR